MAEKSEFTFPDSVSFNEKDGVMEVSLQINGFATRFGIHRTPANAVVDCDFQQKSLCVVAAVTDKKKKETKYRYKIKELPFEILKDECSVKYKDKFICLKLKKADPECIWAYKIQERGGLEMDGDQEV